ncbi:MAG: MFS transporter [Candidatus Thermoplasmatota archaeon]|nr:MFS transporter [Candidatus Thermoplasmatota archaeon]
MKNVEIVAVVSTLRGLAYSSIWVYSSIFMHVTLHISLILVGVIFAAGGAVSGIMQIYGGIVSDRIGYRVTIIFSLSLLCAVYLFSAVFHGFLLSPIIFPPVLVLLMFGNSAQSPATNALVSLSSNVKLRGFSILRIGNNIGWGIGPALGGFLLSYYPFWFLFAVGLSMSLISLAMSFLLEEPERKRDRTISFRTSNMMVIMLSVVGLMLFMVQAQETVTLSNYARIIRNLPYYQLGFVYLTNGLTVVVSQPFLFRASRRIGNFVSYSLGTLLYSAGYLSYAFDSGFAGFIISTIILTFGEDLAFPTSVTMVANASKPENIGKNMGIYNALLSIGRAIGPVVGGSAFSVTDNPLTLWILSTLSGFASLPLFLAYFSGKKKTLDSDGSTGES